MSGSMFFQCENDECALDEARLLQEIDDLERQIYRLQNHIMGNDKLIEDLQNRLRKYE